MTSPDQSADGTAVVPVPSSIDADSDAAWVSWANSYYLCTAVGLVCTGLDRDSGSFEVADPPGPRNHAGSVHGGVIAWIADTALGVTAKRAATADEWPVTAALHTQFIGPGLTPLSVRTHAVGGGRRVRYIDVIVTNADGRTCATAHATMVLRRR